MLRQHVDVSDCVVLGVPDDRFGERVVRRRRRQMRERRSTARESSEADLDAWCRPRLAGYKKPRRFVFVDTMRRSPAGKADYRYLKDLAVEEAGS